MFKVFFLSKKWAPWSVGGALLIIVAASYMASLMVRLNQWTMHFYNLIQRALAHPNTVKALDIYHLILLFAKVVAMYVFVSTCLKWFASHFIFRWRSALNQHYMQHWDVIRHIEGASQRVQDDALRFAILMEKLGLDAIQHLMALIAFAPLLWHLSMHIHSIPLLGSAPHGLLYLSVLSAMMGTLIVGVAGIKLPSLHFNKQKVEAAYRKELVMGENDPLKCKPEVITSLFDHIRQNYFRLVMHNAYLNLSRMFYTRFSWMVPMLFLTPSLITGVITLGIYQQISDALGQIQFALEFFVNGWSDIIELMSVYQRLHAFERVIANTASPMIGLADTTL